MKSYDMPFSGSDTQTQLIVDPEEDYQQPISYDISDKSQQKIPLLYVDVNLGINNQERIIVYEGMSADELANEFSQKHGIYFIINTFRT